VLAGADKMQLPTAKKWTAGAPIKQGDDSFYSFFTPLCRAS